MSATLILAEGQSAVVFGPDGEPVVLVYAEEDDEDAVSDGGSLATCVFLAAQEDVELLWLVLETFSSVRELVGVQAPAKA